MSSSLKTQHTAMMIWVLVALGCQNPPQTDEKGAKSPDNTSLAPGFMWGQRKGGEPGVMDWCRSDWSETMPLNVAENNPGQYFFVAPAGVYRAVIRFGNIAADFMLHRTPDGMVEILTGDNFPMCLSRKENFTLEANKSTFFYDNKKHINFQTTFRHEDAQSVIIFEFPPDHQYGLTIYRCRSCR